MSVIQSFIKSNLSEIESILNDIEDKILERGFLNEHFRDTEYDLYISIKESEGSEKDNLVLEVLVNIMSEDDCKISGDSVEEFGDYVTDFYVGPALSELLVSNKINVSFSSEGIYNGVPYYKMD